MITPSVMLILPSPLPSPREKFFGGTTVLNLMMITSFEPHTPLVSTTGGITFTPL